MKKRIFSMLLVVVMLFSVFPLEVFANYGNVYGRNLGWEYSVITPNNKGGYTLQNPQNSSRYGPYYGDKVNVSFITGDSTVNVTEGTRGVQRNVLSRTSTAKVNITCDYGYYISAIVLACALNDNPFQCQTAATDDAYALALPGSTVTNVTIDMTDIYEWAHHASNTVSYYLMIELEPMPANVYVGYDAGTAGSTKITARPVSETGTVGSATQVSTYPTWNHSTTGLTAAPSHTILGISAAAEAQANALGYSFAGWHLEYYTSYSTSNNAFSGTMSIGGTNLPRGTSVELPLNAKLVAIWQPMLQIEATKVWDDKDNFDGLRPSSVTVGLYANGLPTGQTLLLSAANDWTGIWNAPSKDQDGHAITYSVAETVPDGYSCVISSYDPNNSDVAYGFRLTNTHIVENTITTATGTLKITGSKVWHDLDTSLRPTSITVRLHADGKEIASQVVTGPNWTYSFDLTNGVPNGDGTYSSPVGVTFTVTEDAVANYKLLTSKNPTVTFTDPSVNNGWEKIEPCNELNIQNSAGKTVVAAKTTSQIVVIWSADPLAPYERDLIVESFEGNPGVGNPKGYEYLSGEGVASQLGITVDSQNIYFQASKNWSLIYKGTYTRGSSDATESYLVNTLSDRVITVRKVWDDADNQDNMRPAEVVVHLLAQGSHVGTPVTLNAANNWTASWTVPPLDANGNPITYAVEEVVPKGYTCSVSGNAESGFVLTNTHVLERTNIQAQKVWNDDNDRDGIRPHGVVIQLYANGTAVESYTDSAGKTVSGIATLTDENNWSHQWLDLEKNEAGKVGVAITYTIKELHFVDASGNTVTVPGYTASYGTDETGRLYVENIHEVGRVDIRVSKNWIDDNNRDGIRPEEVVVVLYANGIKTSATATLNEANGWAYTWTDLYEYYHGQKIVYTVQEQSVPAGYEAVMSGDAENGFVLTNTHEVETVDVPVNKVWNDNEDQDGIRPSKVTVALYADGVDTGKTLELNIGNNWSGSFDGLAKYRAGAEGTAVVYTVQEVSVPTGYTASVNGTTITNTHTPEAADLNVQKVWDDFNNNDGKRPDGVIVTLYVNGTPTQNTVTLNEANGWKAIWEDMPRYHNGQRISYSVVETGYVTGTTTNRGIPAGYTADYRYVQGSATVINTYTPETVGLNIQKVWADADNQDGKRPASVTVTLWRRVGANGTWEVVKDSTGDPITKTMDPANEWDVTFTNLPKYAGGEEILYNVVEADVEGYTAEYEFNAAAGVVTVTNTHTPEKTQLTATKVWNDNNDQDGIRPASVKVELYANGVATGKKLTLNSSNNWSGVFSNLDKYFHGHEIVYSVVEEAVTGYTVSYSDITDGKITVTNTHLPEILSIPVSKVWSDNNDQDGIRPDSVTITLYADGDEYQELALDANSNWSGAFRDLPRYKDGGIEIVYTVREDSVPAGYTVSFDSATNTFTNTHIPEKTQLTVTKVWDDKDDQDGKRPDSIVVHLLANGVHTEQKVTLNAANNWTYTWKDLDKYQEAKQVNYTVYEETIGEGYHASYIRNADNSVVITNSRNTEKTTFTTQKVWVDANNQDNIRPYAIAVQLYADGVAHGKPVVLNADNHWRFSWTDLDAHAVGGSGEDVVYTVKEIGYYKTLADLTADTMTKGVPNGYTAAYSTDSHTGIAIIQNTHTVATTSVSVTKVWQDDKNRDGVRPDSIQITLYRNGVAVDSYADSKGNVISGTVTLNAANNWTYTWKDLHVNHGIGLSNTYTVAESGVPSGYTSVTTGDAKTGFIVTNARPIDTVSIPVSKIWADNNDQDGLRPDSVTFVLYADGKATQELTLTAATNWTGAFTGLPVNKSGKVGQPIVDTIGEKTVPTGYTAQVNGYEITNAHIPETADLSVQKAWSDFNNNDGKRPYAVVVHLYVNGRDSNNSKVLNAANSWKATWEDMPRYHEGQRISYTVVEDGYYRSESDYNSDVLTPGLPEGYTATHSYNTTVPNKPIAIITNTYSSETTGLNVQKVWNDDDNRDGLRPTEITVTLWRRVGDNGAWEEVKGNDGKPVSKVMNAANEWDITFTGLPKYADGQLITYNAVESTVAGYDEPVYDFDAATGVVTITNTHTVKRTDVTVQKNWNDNNNQDGIRPDSIEVTLYANGIRTSETVTLSAANSWTYTWNDLYAFYHGSEILYTVVEESVADGYTARTAGSADTGFVINNYHTPKTVTIPVSKVWDDNDDQDGIRPEKISVDLYANDVKIDTIELTADTRWTGNFGELPVNENGQKIAYRVVEADVSGYTAAYETDNSAKGKLSFRITNTHTPEKTQLTAIKQWNDANDQDGKRPDSIVVHLLADGVHTGDSMEITAAMNWAYTWTGLDKYSNGAPIHYTVFEEPVHFKNQTSGNRDIDTYAVSYLLDPNDPTKITIVNTYTPETVNITAMKVWEDGQNRDGLRSDSVTIELHADGVATGKKLTLSDSNQWTAVWEALPKFKNHGTAIVYSVVETEVPEGYTATVMEETKYAPGLFIITNRHDPATTGVKVTKTWNDEQNNDGKRPQGLIVQLYANGSAVPGGTAILDSTNNWSHEWADVNGEPLYIFEGGTEIRYYVDEIGYVKDGKTYDGLPEGYTKETSAQDYAVSITNTHLLEKLSVTVKKDWNDAENNDGLRPESVTVTLYRNGTAINTAVLNETNGWTFTWTGLNRYVAGLEADYTVVETDVEGYTATYEKAATTDGITWTVLNTHVPDTKDVTVTKVWLDDNNAEGYRTSSVTVQLYKDGVAYGDVLTITADGEWKVTVNLPVYEDGKLIEWTVAETAIPRYYSVSYDQNHLTVINTIQSKEIPSTGDADDLALWLGLTALFTAGAAALLIFDRKKRFFEA